MDANGFRNVCAILHNLELAEMMTAGAIASMTEWSRFNHEPLLFVLKLPTERREALWKMIEERMPPATPHPDHVRAMELLGESLIAWEGEEESVKEEHADLIADLGAFLDGKAEPAVSVVDLRPLLEGGAL